MYHVVYSDSDVWSCRRTLGKQTTGAHRIKASSDQSITVPLLHVQRSYACRGSGAQAVMSLPIQAGTAGCDCGEKQAVVALCESEAACLSWVAKW